MSNYSDDVAKRRLRYMEIARKDLADLEAEPPRNVRDIARRWNLSPNADLVGEIGMQLEAWEYEGLYELQQEREEDDYWTGIYDEAIGMGLVTEDDKERAASERRNERRMKRFRRGQLGPQ